MYWWRTGNCYGGRKTIVFNLIKGGDSYLPFFRKEKLKRSILISALVLLTLTIIFQTSNLEIRLLHLFYSPDKGWYLRYCQPWKFLYDYGPIPALVMAGAGFLVFVLSLFYKKLKTYSQYGLFLFLVMVIGPGIIVNAVLKEYWGRPRPRQIKEFNGNMNYLKIWQKGRARKGRSFPSGHASMGFYLFTPYFFLRKKRKRLAYFFLGLGLTSGTLIGLARMIQGAHFITDVIWSGGIVYFTSELLSELMFCNKST